jgi:hypothetical protein
VLPGTFLKWFVTETPPRVPLYFRFIGELRAENDANKRFVLETETGKRLTVNDWFLSWLLPVDGNDRPRIAHRREAVRPVPVPDKPRAAGVPIEHTPPTVSNANWPRLFNK